MFHKFYVEIIEFIICILIILLALLRGGEGVYQLSLLHIAAVVLLMIWLDRQLTDRRATIYFFDGGWTLIAFAIVLGISIVASGYLYGSFFHTFEWFSYLVIGFTIYQTTANCPGGRSLTQSWVYPIFLSLIVCQALYGIFQYFVLDIVRVSGTFSIANYYADFLMIGVLLIFSRLLFGKILKRHVIVTVISLILIGFALYLSGSRGALIAVVVVIVSLIALRNIWIAGLISLLVVITIFILPNDLKNRFTEQDIYSFTRVDIWRQAAEIISEHPLTGVGAGNYPEYALQSNFPVQTAVGRYAKSARIAHNQYLQIAAEFGLPALILFLWFIISYIRQKFKSNNGDRLNENQGVSLASEPDIEIIAVISGFLIHGVVDNSLYTPINALIFFCLIAYSAPKEKKKEFSLEIADNRNMHIYPIFLSVALCALLLFRPISWLYFYQAERLYQEDHLDQAIEKLEFADALSPLNAKFSHKLGVYYGLQYFREKETGWLELSEMTLKRSLKTRPINSDVALDLANTRYFIYQLNPSNSTMNQIVEAYEHALVWNGKNPFIWDKLGFFYGETGYFKEALICFSEAIRLEPNFVQGQQHAAWVYRTLGDPEGEEHHQRETEKILQQHRSHTYALPYEMKLLESDSLKTEH